MKKPFIRLKKNADGYEMLHDETNKSSYEKGMFSSVEKKRLSVQNRQKLLDDVGSGSETETESIQTLRTNSEWSSEFLEKLLLISKKGGCVPPHTYFPFFGDSRLCDILIEESEKLSDEDFANYAGVFGLIGESRMLDILRERFNELKENSTLFDTDEFYNWIASSMETVCAAILRNEPTNIEVAEFLVKLTEHPSSFNRESVIRLITGIHKRWAVSIEVMRIFGEKLNSLWQTKEDKLFIAALPFLIADDREKAFLRIKKIYLKVDDQRREDIIFWLYQLDQSYYWLGRLAREISNEENSALISTLAVSLLQPIPEQDLIDAIRKDLASESPSERASCASRLSNLSKEKAAKLAEEAINDEPDKLIKGLLRKFIAA